MTEYILIQTEQNEYLSSKVAANHYMNKSDNHCANIAARTGNSLDFSRIIKQNPFSKSKDSISLNTFKPSTDEIVMESK